jgi:hypothetical protein
MFIGREEARAGQPAPPRGAGAAAARPEGTQAPGGGVYMCACNFEEPLTYASSSPPTPLQLTISFAPPMPASHLVTAAAPTLTGSVAVGGPMAPRPSVHAVRGNTGGSNNGRHASVLHGDSSTSRVQCIQFFPPELGTCIQWDQCDPVQDNQNTLDVTAT